MALRKQPTTEDRSKRCYLSGTTTAVAPEAGSPSSAPSAGDDPDAAESSCSASLGRSKRSSAGWGQIFSKLTTVVEQAFRLKTQSPLKQCMGTRSCDT